MQKRNLFITVVVVMADLGGVAIAAPISFEMTGSITDIQGTVTFPDSVFVGAPFVARFTYDLNTPDESPDDPQQGRFQHVPPTGANGIAISVGGLTFSSHQRDDLYVAVFNNLTHWPNLDEEIHAPFDYLMVKTLGYYGGREIVFFGTDPTGSVFDGDRLPQWIDADRFSEPGIAVSGWGPDIASASVWYSVVGTVTEVHSVPEPDSKLVALFLLLAFCLAKVGVSVVHSRQQRSW